MRARPAGNAGPALNSQHQGVWWLAPTAGLLVSICLIAASVSAITLSFTVPIAAIALIACGYSRSAPFTFSESGRRALIAATAFPLFAAISALWSPAPELALGKAALTGSLFALTAGAILVAGTATHDECRHFNRGLIVGFLVGLAFLCFENLTDQSGRMFVLNTIGFEPGDLSKKAYKWRDGQIISVSERDIVRNTTPFTLLLMPAMVATLAFARTRFRQTDNRGGLILAAALFIATAIAVFISRHETSKLSLITGLVCIALAWASLTWTRRAIIAAWLAACFLMLPVCYVAYEAGLHKSPYLQSTARHRIGIWREYTDNTLSAPIFGHGAHQARVIGPQIDAKVPESVRKKSMRKMSIHPHNAYVQIWFELGLAGIALFATLGLMLINILPTTSRADAILSYSAFAIGATMISSSYGVWQNWFMSTLVFAAIAVAYTARAHSLARKAE